MGSDGVERAWCGDDEKLSMRTRSLVLLAARLPLIAAAPDWAPRPDDSGQHAHTRTPERCWHWQLLSWSLAAPSRRVPPCSLLVSAKGRYVGIHHQRGRQLMQRAAVVLLPSPSGGRYPKPSCA